MTTEHEGPDARALIERLQRGERDALERFYEAHVDNVYTFVFYRVGRDPTLAEDVVQETFLYALRHLDAFDPTRGSIISWLCISSRNIIRSHLKAQQRTQELVTMWDRIDAKLKDVYDALDSQPLSDEVIERAETQDLVNMTIAHLPAKYRLVLERKYVGGATLVELAAQLETTEEAAKSLLARARRAFRATFTTLSDAMAEA